MIVRTGSRTIDYGPTPGPAYPRTGVSGSLARPESMTRERRVRERTFDPNEWKRRKRATDPEWAARDREKARARKKAA